MSISDDKSEENNISNSNLNNTGENKNLPMQVSNIVEPSTEVGSKKYII